MPAKNALLATYLNDHAAGATSALELLDHLKAAYAGEEIAAFAEALRAEIEKDRVTLELLMTELEIPRSPIRAAFAWAAEKLVRLKLRLDDPSLRGLHLFESLEALSLGIEGKRLLWAALAADVAARPELANTDYAELIRRAERQRADVEARRLEAARAAFA